MLSISHWHVRVFINVMNDGVLHVACSVCWTDGAAPVQPRVTRNRSMKRLSR